SMPRISSSRQPVPSPSRTKLEARVERFQQYRFLIEAEHTRPWLVLPALDSAERVAEVVPLFDCPLEDGLEQAALAADGALGDAGCPSRQSLDTAPCAGPGR